MPSRGTPLEIGKGRILREGTDVAILNFGAHLTEALAAAELLAAEGISVTVADARFAKPLDTDLIDQLMAHHRGLYTLEQGSSGGFGAQVLHYLAATGGLDRGRVVRTLMLPDKFIDQASPAQMYAWAGLTAADIAETVRTTVGKAQVSKLPSRPKLA